MQKKEVNSDKIINQLGKRHIARSEKDPLNRPSEWDKTDLNISLNIYLNCS